MRPKPGKLDKKHPDTTRDAMQDIQDMNGDPKAVLNEIRYMEPNRDRALGEADRTGRHFDEEEPAEESVDEGSEASEQHEAD